MVKPSDGVQVVKFKLPKLKGGELDWWFQRLQGLALGGGWERGRWQCHLLSVLHVVRGFLCGLFQTRTAVSDG